MVKIELHPLSLHDQPTLPVKHKQFIRNEIKPTHLPDGTVELIPNMVFSAAGPGGVMAGKHTTPFYSTDYVLVYVPPTIGHKQLKAAITWVQIQFPQAKLMALLVHPRNYNRTADKLAKAGVTFTCHA